MSIQFVQFSKAFVAQITNMGFQTQMRLSQISQTTDILEYLCETTCVTSFFMSQKGLVAFRTFVFKFSSMIFTLTFPMNSQFKDFTTINAHRTLFNLKYSFQMISQTFLQCKSFFTIVTRKWEFFFKIYFCWWIFRRLMDLRDNSSGATPHDK